ncbi:hypothetical protein SUGI_0628850 [Cryptomeria japonica]|nr:hypothetical protein SUGI_0628850 [Cryptomeria japonica]
MAKALYGAGIGFIALALTTLLLLNNMVSAVYGLGIIIKPPPSPKAVIAEREDPPVIIVHGRPVSSVPPSDHSLDGWPLPPLKRPISSVPPSDHSLDGQPLPPKRPVSSIPPSDHSLDGQPLPPPKRPVSSVPPSDHSLVIAENTPIIIVHGQPVSSVLPSHSVDEDHNPNNLAKPNYHP